MSETKHNISQKHASWERSGGPRLGSKRENFHLFGVTWMWIMNVSTYTGFYFPSPRLRLSIVMESRLTVSCVDKNMALACPYLPAWSLSILCTLFHHLLLELWPSLIVACHQRRKTGQNWTETLQNQNHFWEKNIALILLTSQKLHSFTCMNICAESHRTSFHASILPLTGEVSTFIFKASLIYCMQNEPSRCLIP